MTFPFSWADEIIVPKQAVRDNSELHTSLTMSFLAALVRSRYAVVALALNKDGADSRARERRTKPNRQSDNRRARQILGIMPG